MAITTAELIKSLRAGETVASAAYDPAKQAEGYTKRLEGAGVDVASATDDRGWFGKWLNLNQNQGFFGDLFEIIDRPLNAVSAALIGEDAWASFTGKAEKEYTYTDVMKNMGFDDTTSAILGTIGNIFADPIDIVLFVGGVIAAPFTGGASAALTAGVIASNIADTTMDVAQLTNKISDFAKQGKFLDNIDEVKDVMSGFGKTLTDESAVKILGDIKANKSLHGIDKVEAARKSFNNIWKTPANINNYNALGKTAKKIGVFLSPLDYYNKVQDIGASTVFRFISPAFTKAAGLAKDAAKFGVDSLVKVGVIQKADLDEFAKNAANISEVAGRMFNSYSQKAGEALQKLSDVQRKIMGDKMLRVEELWLSLKDAEHFDAKKFDEVYDVLKAKALASGDSVLQGITDKGVDHLKNLFNTMIEIKYSKAVKLDDLVGSSMHNQLKKRDVSFDNDGFAVMKDENASEFLSFDDNGVLSSTSNGVTTNAKKTKKRYLNSLQGEFNKVRSGENKTGIIDFTDPTSNGYAGVEAAVPVVANFAKKEYGDKAITVAAHVSNSSVDGDIQIFIPDKNGRYVKVAKFEVKSEDFRLGDADLTDKDFVASLSDVDKVPGLVATDMNKLRNELAMLKKNYPDIDQLSFYQLPEVNTRIANYIADHQEIIYVSKGEVFYFTGEELVTLLKKYEDPEMAFATLSYNARYRDKAIVKRFDVEQGKVISNAPGRGVKAGQETQSFTKPVSVVSDAAGNKTFSVSGGSTVVAGVGRTETGAAAGRVVSDIKISINDNMINYLRAKVQPHNMRVETTSLKEMMEGLVKGTSEFVLDQRTYDALSDILNQNVELKNTLNLSLEADMVTKIQGTGVDIYELTETGQDAVKDLMKQFSKGDFPEEYKLLSKAIDRPQFFSNQFLSEMKALAGTPELIEMQQGYTRFMNGMAKIADEMGGVTTEFGKALAKTDGTYIRHTQNQIMKDLLPKYVQGDGNKFMGTLRGSVNDMSNRRYNMTIYEANMLIDAKLRSKLDSAEYTKLLSELGDDSVKLFVDDLSKTSMDYYQTITEKKRQANLLDTIATSDLFTKQDVDNPLPLIRANKPGESKLGYKLVGKDDFMKQANELSKYMDPATAKDFNKRLLEFTGKVGGDPATLLVDGNVYSMIGKLGKPDEAVAPLIGIIDWFNSVFKQTKLLTPGFHLRNTVGNYMNLALSSLSPGELAELTTNLPDYMKLAVRGKDLMRKVANEGIDALELLDRQQYELYADFIKNGFLNASYGLNDIEQIMNRADEVGSGVKKIVDKAVGASAAGNEYVDRMYRLALFDMARKNPSIFQNAGLNNAAEYVRMVLFDPKDLSQFEKNVMRRIIPFYTFTKKNLMYHLKNITQNTKRYRNVNRMLDMAYDLVGADQADAPEYQIDNMYIPIPFTGKDGKFLTFKANLPQSDLNEWIDDPLRRLMSSLTPVLRTPYEIVTNQQVYTGMPISEFDGQQGYKLPFLNRWQEYALSQTGLDAPLGVVSQAASGNFAGALGLGETDIASAARSKAYDELAELRDIMSYYKQEGVRIPTIAELENQGSTSKMDAILRALNS